MVSEYNQIGVIVKDLSSSQLNYYLLKNGNKWIENAKNDIIVFAQSIVRPLILPKFSVMNCVEICGFHGSLVATTLETAALMLNVATTTKRYLYCNDMEYLRGQFRNYAMAAQIYRNPRLELICRGRDHAIAIENCFNRPVKYCMEDFNFDQLLEIIKDNNENKNRV